MTAQSCRDLRRVDGSVRLLCTRVAGHAGRHEAGGTENAALGTVLAWSDGDTYATRQPITRLDGAAVAESAQLLRDRERAQRALTEPVDEVRPTRGELDREEAQIGGGRW